jgi:hypothetical protein
LSPETGATVVVAEEMVDVLLEVVVEVVVDVALVEPGEFETQLTVESSTTALFRRKNPSTCNVEP